MITESLSGIKDLLIEVIDESLNLIKKSENIDYKIKDKNKITGDNPVTEIDLKTQNLIISTIYSKFPKHAILGEEGESKKNVKSDYLWIIDPIDGTKNFINSLPLYSVSIAVMFKGNIVAGGIGLPWKNNFIISAYEGSGLQSSSLKKHLVEDFKPSAGLITFAPTYFQRSYRIKRNFLKFSGEMRNLGSTAAELALVANGNAQLALSGYAFIWDFAAAWILVKESNKKIFFGNMNDNTWQDINPWHKYFNNGLYELDKLKNWRGKFMACQREHAEFLLNNIKPNGRKKKFPFINLF
jgi:myo-inositol-1(or 4)-monophosphatase